MVKILSNKHPDPNASVQQDDKTSDLKIFQFLSYWWEVVVFAKKNSSKSSSTEFSAQGEGALWWI